MSEGRYTLTPSSAAFDSRLSHVQYRILGALGSYTGKDRTAWPRQGEIAKRMGIDRKTVNRACKKLAEYGYLQVQPQFREDGSQTSNFYLVLLDHYEGGVPPEVQGGDRSVTGGVPAAVHHEVDHNNNNSPQRGRARARGDFSLGEKQLKYAIEKGMTEEQASHEFEKFANWCDANGKTYKDWNAAWRNWTLKALEFAKSGKQSRSGTSRTDRSFAEVKEKISRARGMAETQAAPAALPRPNGELDFFAGELEE